MNDTYFSFPPCVCSLEVPGLPSLWFPRLYLITLAGQFLLAMTTDDSSPLCGASQVLPWALGPGARKAWLTPCPAFPSPLLTVT